MMTLKELRELVGKAIESGDRVVEDPERLSAMLDVIEAAHTLDGHNAKMFDEHCPACCNFKDKLSALSAHLTLED